MKTIILILSIAFLMCSRNPIDITPVETPVQTASIVPIKHDSVAVKYDSARVTIGYFPPDSIYYSRTIPDTILDIYGSDSCQIFISGKLIGGVQSKATKLFVVKKNDTLISKWYNYKMSLEFKRNRNLYPMRTSVAMIDTTIVINDSTYKRIGQ